MWNDNYTAVQSYYYSVLRWQVILWSLFARSCRARFWHRTCWIWWLWRIKWFCRIWWFWRKWWFWDWGMWWFWTVWCSWGIFNDSDKYDDSEQYDDAEEYDADSEQILPEFPRTMDSWRIKSPSPNCSWFYYPLLSAAKSPHSVSLYCSAHTTTVPFAADSLWWVTCHVGPVPYLSL